MFASGGAIEEYLETGIILENEIVIDCHKVAIGTAKDAKSRIQFTL
jgi:hypothetical protein